MGSSRESTRSIFIMHLAPTKNLLKRSTLPEDVPYALVGLSGLGDLLGVPAPVIGSSFTLANTITGEDYCTRVELLKRSVSKSLRMFTYKRGTASLCKYGYYIAFLFS